MTRIDFIYRGRGAKCNEKWSIFHIFFRAWNWYRITTWKTHFQLNFRVFWTEVGLNIETNVVYTTPMVFSLNSVGTLKLTMDTKCGHIVKSTLFRTSKWRFWSNGFFLSNGFREIHVNPQIGVRLNIEIISGDELTRYMIVPHYPQEKTEKTCTHWSRATRVECLSGAK